METFFTLQGEGFHQGRSAFFIRLAGCDIACPWCDVKESWDAGIYPKVSAEDLRISFGDSGANFVVVTGGEPMMYDCSELCHSLKKEKAEMALETSGAYPLSGDWDWICVSPKKFKRPKDDVLKKANELKVIVYHKSDLEWAQSFRKLVPEECKLYLQPEWSREKEMCDLILPFIQRNPEWKLSLQIHKYLGLQ